MHPSLNELFENLTPGLLWTQRDGLVRHANAQAVRRTGLAAGTRLRDPDLARAVAAAVSGQALRVVKVAAAVAADGARADLVCRVLPGLSSDDAFVLIDPEPGPDTAFDNLMEVIRSDLHDPLLATRQALALLRPPAGGGEHEADALHDALHELLQVLDKLGNLAELWGSGALLANDRIELWPLLQQVWGAVEPAAVQRGVKARLRARGDVHDMAAMYGSEHWLRLVFQECVESAVRGSRPGTVLEIEHRQLGPRAVIVFRDSGVFASRSAPADSVPLGGRGAAERDPVGRVGAAAERAREQIGLKLCRHIVALHGGHLREEDEDGMRHFVVDLPTGAPHRGADPELDIAQARQYARDLAALMARARARKAAT